MKTKATLIVKLQRNESDLGNVQAVQSGMKTQPFSQFLGKLAPKIEY